MEGFNQKELLTLSWALNTLMFYIEEDDGNLDNLNKLSALLEKTRSLLEPTLSEN